MSIRDALTRALTAPTPDVLWDLRAELWEAGIPGDATVWPVLREFHEFLDDLVTSTTSREYSEFASKLDIGAVGGVVLENVLEPSGAREACLRLFSGMVSEGLMVLATRQHVKAWEGELKAVYRRAAWFLYDEMWNWAIRQKPDLAAGERRRLLDRLFAPVHSAEARGAVKAILLGHLFQMLLVSRLADDVARA